MSEDAQERKARAEEIRRQIARARSDTSKPDEPEEPPQGESLKEAVERRMRELAEAERDEHPPDEDEREDP